MDQRCFAGSRGPAASNSNPTGRPCITELRGAGDLRQREVREVDKSSIGIIRAAHHDYSLHASKVRAAALLASFDVATEEGKRARDLLLGCACRPASAWLDSLPLTRALQLKSGEFQTGLRHRLDTTVLPQHPCQCPRRHPPGSPPPGHHRHRHLCHSPPLHQHSLGGSG
jgi:hypothetical protein